MRANQIPGQCFGIVAMIRSSLSGLFLPRSKAQATPYSRHLAALIAGVFLRCTTVLTMVLLAGVVQAQTNTWVGSGNLATARKAHTATVLSNGAVLITGGWGASSGNLASAELYDPVAGIWGAKGNLNAGRSYHTATLLPNGKVLVSGGSGSSGVLAGAELYDPGTGSWSATGSMSGARLFHTATLLANGKVLVAGNLGGAEVYDPNTGNWSTTGAMATTRDTHTATLLPNGKVLVTGGNNASVGYLASAAISSGNKHFATVQQGGGLKPALVGQVAGGAP